ncbi:MAG: hypothetical protein JXB46_06210 [Candidatus Eisenbacteria bacterium]|nr:hypothetical protein [Candidatus Eisenbacteria bacterium]
MPARLYINATHPTEEGARAIKSGSRQARAVRRVLIEWFEERLTGKLRSQLLDKRTLVGLNDTETRIARVLEVTRGFGGYERPKEGGL